MTWVSRCQSCPRPATRIITGRQPRKTLYSTLTCDTCAPRHRRLAAQAGPVVEEALQGRAQDALF